MEDGIDGRGTQLELWTLLGTTQAVVDATGGKLVRPGKAPSCDAADPARSGAPKGKEGPTGAGPESQEVTPLAGPKAPPPIPCASTKLRRLVEDASAGRPADFGTLPNAGQAAAKHKGKARIAPAKYGNRHIVVVPRFRS